MSIATVFHPIILCRLIFASWYICYVFTSSHGTARERLCSSCQISIQPYRHGFHISQSLPCITRFPFRGVERVVSLYKNFWWVSNWVVHLWLASFNGRLSFFLSTIGLNWFLYMIWVWIILRWGLLLTESLPMHVADTWPTSVDKSDGFLFVLTETNQNIPAAQKTFSILLASWSHSQSMDPFPPRSHVDYGLDLPMVVLIEDSLSSVEPPLCAVSW